MRHNKQSVSFLNYRRWLLLFAVAIVVSLCLAGVNSEHTLAQQPNANSAAQKPRTKRLTPLRTSDTADGSRATITSDGELNDYSAYRSGDRFIVVVPQAEGTGGGGARGRGFEGAQVERRGKDVVYTFKLQPGATARVNQRFNRLDVQFSAPKDATKNTNTAAVAKPTPAPTPVRRTLAEEAGLTKPPSNVNPQPTPNANTSIAAATPIVVPSPPATSTPSPVITPTLAPVATPTVGADQLAQAQQTQPAPVSITTSAPSTASPSVGAVVLRNWPWLLAALLAIGIGLLFVSRRGGDRDESRSLPPVAPSGTKPVTTVKEAKTAELKPASVSTASTKLVSGTTGATGITGGTPATGTPPPTGATSATDAVSTAAAATSSTAAINLATSGKQSKKKKKKEAERAKRLATQNQSKTGGANVATSTPNVEVTTKDSSTITGAAATGAVIAGGAAIIAASDSGASKAAESKTTESKSDETKVVEAKAAEVKALQPSVDFDPERIEVEIKKLLAGESYDESYINATGEGTRQLVSAELMSAIAGRNEARKGHARAAFLKHGYFDEATRALQSAEAPGERAAAARTLGLVGDRNSTSHLVAALEDPSADVRRTTVEALAELQDPAAVGALEALRWRETSRQVPRALIQRAIEASKVAEEEEVSETTAATALDADTPTLVTATVGAADALTATEATAASEAKEAETKEVELVSAPSGVTASTVEPSEVSEIPVEPSPVLAAMETSPVVEPEDAVDELKATGDETKVDEPEIIEDEPKGLELAAPAVEGAPSTSIEKEAKAEVVAETAPVKTDLAATFAAKEANLIKARELETDVTAESATAIDSTTPSAVASSAPTSTIESQATSFVSGAPEVVEDEAATEVSLETPSIETPPVYQSDFALSSGHVQPASGAEDWIDLDADEHDVTIQTAETAASRTSPVEPPAEQLDTYYAEDAAVWSSSSKTETPAPPATEIAPTSPVSLFDSLEVETFETNAAEPVSYVATPIDLEDAATQPLAPETHPPLTDDDLGGTGVVKADKGLSLIDGSDEDDYSIIPKGIQVRLTSDEASERAASVLALSRLNTDEAFNEICAAFDDPAGEVRNAAARALYDLSEDRADSFTRALRESPLERRRHIGDALAGSGLAEQAIGNLTGESRDKTYDAFSLLFLMAKAGEVAPLIHAIESHPDSEVRLAVVKLLALSGQHEILPAFRRLAVRGSLPAEVRSAVMEAIYQISSQPQNATPTT